MILTAVVLTCQKYVMQHPADQTYCTIKGNELATAIGRCVSGLLVARFGSICMHAVVFGGVGEDLLRAARPSQAFPGTHVKHRSKGET